MSCSIINNHYSLFLIGLFTEKTLKYVLHFVSQFSYWFDDLRSLNMSLLYNPLLSIPASGIIPTGPTG